MNENPILLVEDNRVNQIVALAILGRVGARVEVAANGVEAIEALKRSRFDAVLMDVQMPEMDGLEATALVRSGRSGVLEPAVPIIAMTAHATREDREQCLRVGMNDYISKPFHPGVLMRILDGFLLGRAEGRSVADDSSSGNAADDASNRSAADDELNRSAAGDSSSGSVADDAPGGDISRGSPTA